MMRPDLSIRERSGLEPTITNPECDRLNGRDIDLCVPRSKIQDMARRLHKRALLSVMALLCVSGVCVAQRYVPPPPQLTVDPCAVQPNPKFPVAPDPKAKPPVCPPPAPASTDSARPAAAEQFPFPGDAPAKSAPGTNTAKPSSADAFPFPGSAAPAAPAPNAPVATKPAGGAADQFPYPGETNKSPDAVPEGDTPRYVPDSPDASGKPPSSSRGSSNPSGDSSSSSSSSSSGDSSSSTDDDKKPASADDDDGSRIVSTRHKLPKVSAQSPDERVTEDLNVAKFYSDRGNFQAAYLRSKDATKAMPDDAESHFALAQAAQKLQKKDEAVAEYSLYLKLEPRGDRMVAAQKALAELR
jgi:hypothetical protein